MENIEWKEIRLWENGKLEIISIEIGEDHEKTVCLFYCSKGYNFVVDFDIERGKKRLANALLKPIEKEISSLSKRKKTLLKILNPDNQG